MANKNIWIFIVSCWTALCISCSNDSLSAGSSALAEGEDVLVCTDTLKNIHTEMDMAAPVQTVPDSFLLGECQMQDYGKLKADVLTQFACPEGWVYPDSSELDSVCLYVYYRSWFGNGNAPLGLQAYVLDRKGLEYGTQYTSDLRPEEYTSATQTAQVLREKGLVVPADPSDSMYSSVLSAYVPYARFRLNDKWAKYLFEEMDYTSQDAFNKQFPGLYITSEFGEGCALYVNAFRLVVHYHYTYHTPAGIQTMQDTKVLYANSEVKQAVRYDYVNRQTILQNLQTDTTCHHIVSPANLLTRLDLPTKEILQSLRQGVLDRRGIYVNLARLKVDVLNGESQKKQSDNWAEAPERMMLVKETELNHIVYDGNLPTDTTAILSTLESAYNSTSEETEYYYHFDLSGILSHVIATGDTSTTDTLRFILVPVSVEYTTSNSVTSISSVTLLQSVTAAKIRSAFCTDYPMNVEMVYSGFSDSRIR